MEEIQQQTTQPSKQQIKNTKQQPKKNRNNPGNVETFLNGFYMFFECMLNVFCFNDCDLCF